MNPPTHHTPEGANRTPTPWHSYVNGAFTDGLIFCVPIYSGGALVAIGRGMTMLGAIENAAFIVESANNHERLQSALTASEAARAELQERVERLENSLADMIDMSQNFITSISEATKDKRLLSMPSPRLQAARSLLAQPPATTEDKP